MRIEQAQHGRDGAAVQGAIGVHRDRVVALNDGKNAGEGPDGFLDVGSARGGGAHRGAVYATENGGDNEHAENQQGTTSVRHHASLTFARLAQYSMLFSAI